MLFNKYCGNQNHFLMTARAPLLLCAHHTANRTVVLLRDTGTYCTSMLCCMYNTKYEAGGYPYEVYCGPWSRADSRKWPGILSGFNMPFGNLFDKGMHTGIHIAYMVRNNIINVHVQPMHRCTVL